jgi:hypothetical protein
LLLVDGFVDNWHWVVVVQVVVQQHRVLAINLEVFIAYDVFSEIENALCERSLRLCVSTAVRHTHAKCNNRCSPPTPDTYYSIYELFKFTYKHIKLQQTKTGEAGPTGFGAIGDQEFATFSGRSGC